MAYLRYEMSGMCHVPEPGSEVDIDAINDSQGV